MKTNKLENLKKQLINELKGQKRYNRLKKEYKNKPKEDKEPKIIGITGSRGKSTTAYIVHEYLKFLGYKSILYSSLGIDSPASIVDPNEACEIAFKNKNSIFNMIEEAEKYGADYVIMEINESTIEKGILKDVPFTVRAITNLNPKHNDEQYTVKEYVDLKKLFFKTADRDCKCVIGMQYMEKELFEEFLNLNNCPKYTFGSQYIADIKDIDKRKIDCLLYELYSNMNGLQMKFKLNDISYNVLTNTMLSINALNFMGAITILNALNEFNISKFNECVKNLVIPGREEVIKVNGRTIVIDTFLSPALEEYNKFKTNKEINSVKVVVGAVGTGFKTWNDRYKSDLFLSKRRESRKYAMSIVEKYADFAYLTCNDNAKENVLDICEELQGYLLNCPTKIIVDREEAIKMAIRESKEGDLIFISGRGNRRILCNSESTIKLLKDKEVVEKTIKELGW